MAIKYRIEGLKEIIRRTDPRLLLGPLRDFFKRAAIVVQSSAREKAPVDTGRLRSSIAYQIDSSEPPLWTKIGTNVKYAPYMEYGTGPFAEGPGAKGGRHWPPGPPLSVWAARHGFSSGYQVARIIGQRGGLRPRRYLRAALKESLAQISGLVRQLGADIRDKWK